MRPPRVSVVIPCYDLGEFVAEAVDSALRQTCSDLEVIVIDDGSTDERTRDVLADLDRERTAVHRIDHAGLPAARNFGIGRSRGEFICALDADDRLRPQFLEKAIRVLDADPAVGFVSTWVQCFGTEEWVWRQDRCDFPALLAECVVTTAAPVRRAALEALGGYDTTSYLYGCEDWDLWISLTEQGWRGVIVPEVLFDYRQRPGSMRGISESAAVRQRVWQTLLEKHVHSYRRFAAEVFLWHEQECGRLLRDNWDLQYDIETRLLPAVAQHDGRIADGGEPPTPAARAPADAAVLQQLHDARAEVDALRRSASWRVTAPLRRFYEVYLSLNRRGGGAPS